MPQGSINTTIRNNGLASNATGYKTDNSALYYLYYYYESGKKEIVYYDPDHSTWHTRCGKKVDEHFIKKQNVKFSDLYKVKPTAPHVHPSERIKKTLNALSIDPGENIVLNSNPFALDDKGTLKFAGFAHAKEFFELILNDICYGYLNKRGYTESIMPLYLDLVYNRFNKGNLTININNIIPNYKGINAKKVAAAKAFHEAVWGRYVQLKPEYAKKIIIFSELGLKNFKSWKNPQEKKRFLEFYKQYSGDKKPENFKRVFLNKKIEQELFTLEIEKHEINLGLGIYDDLCVLITGAISVSAPAISIKKLKNSLVALGPVVPYKENTTKEEMKNFRAQLKLLIDQYGQQIKNQELVLVMISNLDGGRVALIKNTEQTRKEFDKCQKQMDLHQGLETFFNPKNKHIEELDPVNIRLIELDKALTPAFASMYENNEALYRILRGLYMWLRGVASIVNFVFNPLSKWSFYCIIQDFPGLIAQLIYDIKYGNETKVIDSICSLIGIFHTSHHAVRYLVKKGAYPPEYYAVEALKKYFRSEQGLKRIRQLKNLLTRVSTLPTLKIKPAFKPCTIITKPKAPKPVSGLAAEAKTVRKIILQEIKKDTGKVAARGALGISAKQLLRLGAGVWGGVALNVLLDDSHIVHSAGNYSKYMSGRRIGGVESRFTEKEYDNAFDLYCAFHARVGALTTKDIENFNKYPVLFVYIKFAKNKKIQNMPARKVKAMINSTIECINKKYFDASQFTVDEVIKAFEDYEKTVKMFNDAISK